MSIYGNLISLHPSRDVWRNEMGTGSNMMGLADHCRVTELLDLIGKK